jgi:hypothetical protein
MGWGGIDVHADGDCISVGETDFCVEASEYRALLDDYAGNEEALPEWAVAWLADFLDYETRNEVDYKRHESKEAATQCAREAFERRCAEFNRLSAEEKADLAGGQEEELALGFAGTRTDDPAAAESAASELQAVFARNAARWAGEQREALLRRCAEAAVRKSGTDVLLRCAVDRLGLRLDGDAALLRQLLMAALERYSQSPHLLDCVRFLLQRGAPVGEALTSSHGVCSESLLRLLLEHKKPAMQPQQLGWLLYNAAKRSSPGAVRLLLSLGADVNVADTSKPPPLVAAASSTCLDSVRVLLDAGASIEAVDPTPPPKGKGHTALMAAAAAMPSPCKLAVVQLLLERGARRDAVDADGCTALQLGWCPDIKRALRQPAE